MDRIQSLKVFIAVAEATSFAAGARSIGLSAASVTRGINELETHLGTRLFTRTTRQVRLTEVGAVYLEDARSVIAQLQAADDLASGAATNPTGLLRITCSNEFGRIYVSPILTDYLDTYPQVTAEVLVVDRIVNIVEEGLDVGVRLGSLASSGLSAVRVGQVRRVICGSPAYFRRHGYPATPQELQNHNMIAAAPVSPVTDWRFGVDLDKVVKLKPRLTVSSVSTAREIACSGWGLSRVLSYQIGAELERQELEIVLEDYEPEPLPIHLVHAEGRRATAKVRSFLDFARERLRDVAVLN